MREKKKTTHTHTQKHTQPMCRRTRKIVTRNRARIKKSEKLCVLNERVKKKHLKKHTQKQTTNTQFRSQPMIAIEEEVKKILS